MIERLFLAHPRDVGESYWQHLRTASRFGSAMMTAGFACFVHGLVPALFTRTGSRTVGRLHAMMTRRWPAPAHGANTIEHALIYEI